MTTGNAVPDKKRQVSWNESTQVKTGERKHTKQNTIPQTMVQYFQSTADPPPHTHECKHMLTHMHTQVSV